MSETGVIRSKPTSSGESQACWNSGLRSRDVKRREEKCGSFLSKNIRRVNGADWFAKGSAKPSDVNGW